MRQKDDDLVIIMGCSQASRLTKELKHTNDEIDNLKKVLSNSTQLGQALDNELSKISKTEEVLINNNQKIQQEILISKTESGVPVNLSVFESDKNEETQFREWIELEMTQGCVLISTLAKLHGLEEDEMLRHETKKQMEGLEASDYATEKLKEFTQWKARKAQEVLAGLTEDRLSWMEFVEDVESTTKSLVDLTDRETEGRARPLLAEIRAKLMKLPPSSQLLARYQYLADIEKQLNLIRFSSGSDSDGESKSLITRQAEEIKQMTQMLAMQRRQEDERRGVLEGEISKREAQIKHLEVKVKDLSRPSPADTESKAKDREVDRLRLELTREQTELMESKEEFAQMTATHQEKLAKLQEVEEEVTKSQQ